MKNVAVVTVDAIDGVNTARSLPTHRIAARPLNVPRIGGFAADTEKLFPSRAATDETSSPNPATLTYV
jgi:hypothetical protein